MKLNTVQSLTASAENLQDIIETFEDQEFEVDCDSFDSDAIHYSIFTPDDGYIQIHYNFMRGVCYISTNEDEDMELVIHFSITRRYISN